MPKYSAHWRSKEAQKLVCISAGVHCLKVEFKWTKRRIRKAMELHDNPSCSFESIASRLGCDPDEVRAMLHRELQIGMHGEGVSSED
jgi:DNA-directed RNA polymerase sigma subunit (sigma70/sigma32)